METQWSMFDLFDWLIEKGKQGIQFQNLTYKGIERDK